MEDKKFPFLQIMEQKTKRQFSFNDTLEELKDIKLVELGLGRDVDSIKITELNELQTQILKLFKMKKNDLGKEL